MGDKKQYLTIQEAVERGSQSNGNLWEGVREHERAVAEAATPVPLKSTPVSSETYRRIMNRFVVRTVNEDKDVRGITVEPNLFHEPVPDIAWEDLFPKQKESE